MTRQKVTDPSLLAQLGSSKRTKVTDPNLLAQLNSDQDLQEPEEQFLQPQEESFLGKLPRNIAIGLANLGHKATNTPYEMAKQLQGLAQPFAEFQKKNLPGLQGTQKQQSYLDSMVQGFNQKHNVPEELKNPNYGFNVENIPHQQEQNYEELFGQKGSPTMMDKLIQGGIEYLPEIASAQALLSHAPITARGLTRKMSMHKKGAVANAKEQYSNLFNEANEKGITHVNPPESVIENRARITANSQAKHNRSLNEYLLNPTLENAHWAQSELGALERHLESIANKQGLTPSQHKTLRAAQESRNDIRQEMFSNNALGASPELGEQYQTLANQYRERVIPYTRLEELTETEQNRMLPKKAINKLLKDDQFIIELAKRYPGLRFHTPTAKSLRKGAIKVGAGLAGYEGLKKLFS